METENLTIRHKGMNESGTITDQGVFTLALLGSTGPKTANEVMAFAKERYPFLTHATIESINKRFSELADRGAVRKQLTSYGKTRQVRCSITNKMCCVWELTGNEPATLTTRQRLQAQIAKAESRLTVLKNKLARTN